MEYLLPTIIGLLGAAAICAWYSRNFERKGFQLWFFSLSILFIIAVFVMIFGATQVTSVTTFNNTTLAFTEVMVVPDAIAGVSGGFITILSTGFVFILAIFLIYFIMDSIMLIRKAKVNGD